jgi:hypothetical protein
MGRISAVVCCTLLAITSWGQISLKKLELKSKEVYTIKESDIIVVDSLIMRDSSKIILNKLKPVNFIHAKVAVFYKGTVIEGRGVTGLKGKKGKTGSSPQSPCTDGGPGTRGTEGTYGGHGTSLMLYLSDIVLKGNVTIDVSGGDGGDGGAGGDGGGGGTGTRVCKGGDGGPAGDGGLGGNGGNAGTVTFTAPRIPELRLTLGEKVIVKNYGGNAGNGGDGGVRGLAGLNNAGNAKLDGKSGKKGLSGTTGIAGKDGAVNFQDK